MRSMRREFGTFLCESRGPDAPKPAARHGGVGEIAATRPSFCCQGSVHTVTPVGGSDFAQQGECCVLRWP